MADPVTSWSTLALAVIAFISLWISIAAVVASNRGIKEQTKNFAASVSADLCLKLVDRFDAPEMLVKRNNAAKALLRGSNFEETDPVFDFFEIVGLYLRRKTLDAELAHSMFFHWVNLYWNAGKDYIAQSRQRSATLYSDFEYLYKTIHAIEIRTAPESRDINPTKADLEAFLKQELEDNPTEK